MRTSLWIALLLLLAVILTGVLTEGAMQRVSQRYAQAAGTVEAAILAGDWQGAETAVATLLAAWQQQEPALQTLINHDDTDSVTCALVTLQAAIRARDEAGCLEACAALREHAQHLHHRDAFTLANVL